MKKGFVFTLDILLGTSILLLSILMFGSYWSSESTFQERQYEKLSYIADDTMEAISHLKASSFIDKPTIANLVSKNVIKEADLNKTILDLIASFWYAGNRSIALNISKEVMERITLDFCIGLYLENESIYSSCSLSERNTAVSARIETGYMVGKPTQGYLARAFLTSIKSKTESAYAYFGGFVGEGNITRIITLPIIEVVNEAYIEFNAGNNFSLYINNQDSGFYTKSSGDGNMTADTWNINYSYLDNFNSGDNIININFTGNGSYIGGGYLRVSYNTSEMITDKPNSRYYFPGIHGLINLYSSFYVQGNISSMNASLHYLNNIENATLLFTIGNATVYKSNASGEQTVFLNNTEINSSLALTGLDYEHLSEETIPIRFGLEPGSPLFIKQGQADVILITDLSGSMNWKMNSSDDGNVISDCGDPEINSSNTSRISLARCLDKEFINIIMNVTGNRMGLVGFNSDAYVYTPDLGSTREELITHIDGYPEEPSGGTCICCAINRAYNILNTYSNSSREKYIIVMSDGIPSACCGCADWFLFFCISCNSTGTSTASQFTDCFGSASDCTGNSCNGAMQNANYSSCRVHNDLDAVVHSIGFGPVASCPNANWTLRSIASCGEGLYYASADSEELREIYRRIAENIVIRYKAQVITIDGNISAGNILYPDSYIGFDYTPNILPYEYGEISLTRETARFRNFTGDTIDIPYKEGWFNVSEKVRIADAKITSYSSEFWTDRVYVNNPLIDWTGIYWLGDYIVDYQSLGDPYIVQIPLDYISSGNNSVRIGTGVEPSNATGGSPDNRIIYTIRVSGSVGYGDMLDSYESATADAIQRLENEISDYVEAGEGNIATETKNLKGLRWLWGPSLIKVLMWEK